MNELSVWDYTAQILKACVCIKNNSFLFEFNAQIPYITNKGDFIILDELDIVLHRIRVKLYPNYLPRIKGSYIAKTENEAVLGIGQICAALKSKGKYTGNYDDFVNNIKKFYEETAYQLCDGYAVNTGYYTVYPNIEGTFDSVYDKHDKKKNPVGFRFKTNKRLRSLADRVKVEIAGLSDCNAFIEKYVDNDEDTVNGLLIPGNLFSIYGNKIKIAGDDPDCGVFFVSDNEPIRTVRVKRVSENSGSKISGMVPDTIDFKSRIEIRTQYTGSTTIFLKKPRVIASEFVLETA